MTVYIHGPIARREFCVGCDYRLPEEQIEMRLPYMRIGDSFLRGETCQKTYDARLRKKTLVREQALGRCTWAGASSTKRDGKQSAADPHRLPGLSRTHRMSKPSRKAAGWRSGSSSTRYQPIWER